MIGMKKQTHNIQAMEESEYKLHKKLCVIELLKNLRICPFLWTKNIFSCIYCNEVYTDLTKLREHCLLVHDNIKESEIRNALTKKKIRAADLLKVDITNVSCKLCDATIEGFDDLKTHLVKNHKHNSKLLPDDVILPFKFDQGSFKCGVCNNEFYGYMTLFHHLKSHFHKYICEHCGSGFLSAYGLRIHKASHETGYFPCSGCDKVFKTKVYRQQHEKIVHMKAKLNRCPHCSETFTNYIQKLNHIISAHGIKAEEFKCNMCTRVFVIKGRLNRHVRITHEKKKPHACDECDGKFSTNYALKEHMLKHTGERKYECAVCQKTYGRKFTLREHMRTHLNDRRFVCGICGNSFVQKCSLKQHGRSHHPNDPNPAGKYD